jgi:hypothetical protein
VINRRSADDLRAVVNQAWPQIQALIEGSPNQVQVLTAGGSQRDIALEALQKASSRRWTLRSGYRYTRLRVPTELDVTMIPPTLSARRARHRRG